MNNGVRFIILLSVTHSCAIVTRVTIAIVLSFPYSFDTVLLGKVQKNNLISNFWILCKLL